MSLLYTKNKDQDLVNMIAPRSTLVPKTCPSKCPTTSTSATRTVFTTSTSPRPGRRSWSQQELLSPLRPRTSRMSSLSLPVSTLSVPSSSSPPTLVPTTWVVSGFPVPSPITTPRSSLNPVSSLSATPVLTTSA